MEARRVADWRWNASGPVKCKLSPSGMPTTRKTSGTWQMRPFERLFR